MSGYLIKYQCVECGHIEEIVDTGRGIRPTWCNRCKSVKSFELYGGEPSVTKTDSIDEFTITKSDSLDFNKGH